MGNRQVRAQRDAELSARAALVFAWRERRIREEEEEGEKEKEKGQEKNGRALACLPPDMLRLVALSMPLAALTTLEALGKQPRMILMFHGVRRQMKNALKAQRQGLAARAAADDGGYVDNSTQDGVDSDADLSDENFESEVHAKRKNRGGGGFNPYNLN